MKLFNKIVAIALAGAVSVIGFAGCSSSGSENRMAQIEESGKLVMYTNAVFPPYEFLGTGDEIIGIDVEIGRAIADELGVELEVVNSDFDGVISAIESGKGDVGISGITITEERAEQVDFSVPYLDAAQALIVPAGSEISTVEELASKRVGAQTGSTGYLYLEDQNSSGLLSRQPCSLQAYEAPTDAMLALKEGKLDAVVVDTVVAQQLINGDANYTTVTLQTADGTVVEESNGVVVAKGNEDLLEVIDGVITDMNESGEMDQLLSDYTAIANGTLSYEDYAAQKGIPSEVSISAETSMSDEEVDALMDQWLADEISLSDEELDILLDQWLAIDTETSTSDESSESSSDTSDEELDAETSALIDEIFADSEVSDALDQAVDEALNEIFATE